MVLTRSIEPDAICNHDIILLRARVCSWTTVSKCVFFLQFNRRDMIPVSNKRNNETKVD